MKMHVITNEQGDVIATAPAGKIKNFTVTIEPVEKHHKLHKDVDLPDDLRELKNVEEFHAHVRKHLPKK